MAFNRAHSFSINVRGDFNQVDNSGRGNEMQVLVNAACPSASYQSADRADPPRCHPDTRKEVISQIMDWVNSSDLEKRIMWLSAAAGAGKSSVAQTIAEKCSRDGKLLSSFFFSRTASGSGRDDGNRLIPTIAYHLAVSVPEAKDLITLELERDPAFFQHSMDAQLKSLVMNPVIHLRNSGRASIPFVVVIDGLDECNGIPVQSRIISTIAKSISGTPSHIRFFFASRPERDIQKAFDKPPVVNATIRLTLEENEQAYRDIEVYLKSEFYSIKNTHILKNELANDHEWPSKQDIWTLVNRSSGHFIYASTVMKYIANDDQDPREALSAIIHRSTITALEDSPFAELDALYIHILKNAVTRTKGGYDAILSILQVLALTASKDIIKPTYDFAGFLGVKESAVKLRMMHLQSLIYIPDSGIASRGLSSRKNTIKFHHASFKDFLLDPQRSADFFVNPIEGHIFMGSRCLAIFLNTTAHTTNSGTMFSGSRIYPNIDLNTVYASNYFFIHLERSKFNTHLLNEFLRIVDMKSMVSVIINKTRGARRAYEPFDSIFEFYFDRVNDFAVPKVIETAEICKRVSNTLDEIVLDTFTDTPMLNNYAKVIAGGTGKTPRFIFFWAVKIMDIPERGKHIYISDEKAKYLISSILKAPVDYKPADDLRTTSILEIYQSSWPSALQYLFERIKPSKEFGSDIIKHLRRIDWLLYVELEPESRYVEPVYRVLEKCGLSKEIRKMRWHNENTIWQHTKARRIFSASTDSSESEYESESE